MKPLHYTTLLTFILLLSGHAQAASETTELEINHPLPLAQEIAIPGGNVTITAILGNVTGTAVDDLDYFVFSGQEGNIVTLDIDEGTGGLRSVDTVMAIFDSNGQMLRLNDDAYILDEGSIARYDSLIENFRLPVSGNYIVAVSNYPRYFSNGGNVSNGTRIANGDYKLLISGVTSPIQQINIDIKPGNDNLAPINPRSKGKIPVALLSSSEFNALDADIASLTFGSSGNEVSLSHCNTKGNDINNDGFPDLLCHFENQQAGFVQGDLEAVLRGKQAGGSRFEGRGLLKIVPEKRSGI
ncbi:MAG: DVUA0089 family protein [Gallionellaceae bacterium]|jgi:hypothetical protein